MTFKASYTYITIEVIDNIKGTKLQSYEYIKKRGKNIWANIVIYFPPLKKLVLNAF